jgi:uridine phosphorylase
MADDPDQSWEFPLSEAKAYDEPSVFSPDSLLAEARRQKGLSTESVPDICVLDPDGDIIRYLRETGQATRLPSWPGYHTTLYQFERNGTTLGIIGCAVGASFAVLVAEQLFAAGCEFLVSITSSGQIEPRDDPPYFVLIERALRDEGTSYHYRHLETYAHLDSGLQEAVINASERVSQPVYAGATWTTDAPFRETETAIERARSEDILAVEMEAAALYTFATVRNQPVVCFAHVTNQMGQVEEDFEKGDEAGSKAALEVVDASIEGWDTQPG